MEYCTESGLLPVLGIVKDVIRLLQIGIPIILILMGTIDLGKAVISSKDEEMKKAQGILIKRIIYAVAVFLVFFIVNLVMTIVSDNAGKNVNNNTKDWRTCWNKA